METKSQKFQRLAESRTKKAISAIRSLGKLSNRGHYEYDEEQVRHIFSTLRKELEESKAFFDRDTKQASKVEFKL